MLISGHQFDKSRKLNHVKPKYQNQSLCKNRPPTLVVKGAAHCLLCVARNSVMGFMQNICILQHVYVYCVIFSKFAVRQRILYSIIYPSPQHLADKPSGNHNPKQPQNDAPPTELKQTHRQHNRPAMNSTTLPRHCLNLQNVYSATTFESAKRARNEHLHTLQNTPSHGPTSQPCQHAHVLTGTGQWHLVQSMTKITASQP